MNLDEDSFLLYAAKCYDMRTAISAEEFYDDLRRFQHLKRLFKRYQEDNDLKVKLFWFWCNYYAFLQIRRLS